MNIESTVRLLLNSAVRKDRDSGHRFYQALHTATVEELQEARIILNGIYARLAYTYYPARVEAIRQRLAEIEAQS